MTRTAAISVAISTRDRPQALARCLASLRAGSVLPAEVIVVDQSRGDDTRRLLGGARDVRYVPHAGSGLGASQNIAFAHAAQDVVAVTDDDCVVDVRWLEAVESGLSGPRAPAALTGRVMPLGPDTPGRYPVSTRQSTVPRQFSIRSRPWEVGSGNNFAVRREWWERIGGNDERLGPGAPGLGAVDIDLFYRLLRTGAGVRYEPAAVVFHERTTLRGRSERRFPYGHGIGAMCAVWLRSGDLRAVLILARWLGFRLRRLLRGLRGADLTLAHEELLVLMGTVCGVVRGARWERRVASREVASQPLHPPFPARPPAPSATAQVSIVITNHNYGAFLPAALASAVGQRGADIEVLVVDDGSTDDSREVIARHEGQVRSLLQENRGQKAAFNAALDIVGGDVVLFLDADDELKPGIAAAVAGAFAANPGAARVVFRLEVVDEAGRATGETTPSAGVPLPHGDVRSAVLAFPDDLPWPPTSGNAFAAWALRRVMPLPLDEDPTGADSCLHPLIPMLGPVVALECVGGSYRLHGKNAHWRDGVDADRSRLLVRRAHRIHADLDRLARELGHGGARPRSVTIAAHRMVSLRLGGPGHPTPGDTRWRVLGAGLRAASGRTDVSAARRVGYAAWFAAAALAPRPVARALAEAALQPVRRGGRLRRLVGR